MFGFLKDIAKGAGEIVGTATGLIVGVPVMVISDTLGISVDIVKQAINSGCKTYDEIKDFHRKNK